MKVSLAAPALILLATAAHARDKDRAGADAKVCRYVRTTQALFGKSVCHSVAEWKRIDANSSSDVTKAGLEPRLRSNS